MPLTWAEWSALSPKGEMVDHPEILGLAEAMRRNPAFWAWADSDGPPGLRATAHIAFAALLRLRARFASFSDGMGCRVPAGPALDEEMGIPGFYDSLQAGGFIESVNLSAGTATVRSRSCQEVAASTAGRQQDRVDKSYKRAIGDTLERMGR